MKYSTTNPELKILQNMGQRCYRDTLRKRNLLLEEDMKNYNILVTFLREFMWLYDGKERRCFHYGIKEKETEVYVTEYMGHGLKAMEYIQKGEYIVPYEGYISFDKPKGNSEYVVEIQFESDVTKGKRLCYIDAKNSKSKGRYCNHSCDHNAVIYKIMKHGYNIPKLWVKAIRNINPGDEICVHYGNDMERMLRNMGGCLCIECRNAN